MLGQGGVERLPALLAGAELANRFADEQQALVALLDEMPGGQGAGLDSYNFV